jgi:hypothetical protein
MPIQRRYEIKTFEELLGHTIKHIDVYYNELIFTLDNGQQFKQYHEDACCEHVYIEDICGDLVCLLGEPILIAEEVSNSDHIPFSEIDKDSESFTWTFYKLATVQGYVTIRWFGESNGDYSESVDWMEIKNDKCNALPN